MAIKDPMHVEEITPQWLTHALREGGYLKDASVKSIEKKIIGDAKGFLSSVVQVKIEYDTIEKDAPVSVVVKIEPEEGERSTFTGMLRPTFRFVFPNYTTQSINLLLILWSWKI